MGKSNKEIRSIDEKVWNEIVRWAKYEGLTVAAAIKRLWEERKIDR